MTQYFENLSGYNSNQQSFEPLDEYRNIMLEDFYSKDSRKKIVKMAIKIYQDRYHKKPLFYPPDLNKAMDDISDFGQRWKQSITPHNLRINAAQRLVERMVELDYFVHLDWFQVQANKVHITSEPMVCGSHFTDHRKVMSVNIV